MNKLGVFCFGLIGLIGVAASGTQAATLTLEASITGISGSQLLLDELGIDTGAAQVRVTFDNDVSGGAGLVDNANFKFDYLSSHYAAFSLVAPNKTITAAPSNASTHRVYTRDGIEDRNGDVKDMFLASSSLYSSDPNSYYTFHVSASDRDETKWKREDLIVASLLNSFSNHSFALSKFIGGSRHNISGSTIAWTEVSAVPVPASLPLLIAGLGALGFMRRKRRGAA